MSQEMKSLFIKLIKYNFIGASIFILIIIYFFNIKIALIFSLGLLVSLINLILNGYILEYSIFNEKSFFLILGYFLRIAIVLLIAVPFLNNLMNLLSYVIGYISQFIFICYYSKNIERK